MVFANNSMLNKHIEKFIKDWAGHPPFIMDIIMWLLEDK